MGNVAWNLQEATKTTRRRPKYLQSLINQPQTMDGLTLFKKLKKSTISCVVFDPQYRGILDKQHYGNEGKSREIRRCALKQMDEKTIMAFIQEIARVLEPSGHLFFWMDKFHLCEGIQAWFTKTALQSVDLVVWEKPRIGMGYRTRNKAEFLMIFQKKPIRAKGVWRIHNIPNVWRIDDSPEDVNKKTHPHAKPIYLQAKLIEAVTHEAAIVLDPAMGSGSVFKACCLIGRDFIGGDLDSSYETG